ncbi:hypothetical protein [Microbispora bryophytorum]|uniref:hypothetical protein n=1 Tax=Microbispora bryophytorum TaxID=1460882 RepID=UPI0037232F32
MLSALVAEITGAVAGEAWETAFRGLSGADSGSVWWLMSAPAYVPSVLGALVAVLLHRRIGTFRLAWWALIVTRPFTLLLALSGIGPAWVWYVLGTAVPATGSLVASVALLSHRQAVTPHRLLGRTGAVLVVLTTVAGGVADLLEGPAERLTEVGGAALATVAALAATIPLLRARRSAAGHEAGSAGAFRDTRRRRLSFPHEDLFHRRSGHGPGGGGDPGRPAAPAGPDRPGSP